jgi:tetratricopeptide (TPR) repeat protein
MSHEGTGNEAELTERLASQGYWPAVAARHLAQGRPSSAIAVCRERLQEGSGPVSGRLIYARALYRSGQVDEAAEQFRRVLGADPDNLVALKYLGDIRFASGDQAAAMSYYGSVLDIDPACRGLYSEVKKTPATTTRTVTLTRGPEFQGSYVAERLRQIPFYTETMGDLYLAQGHPRLAAEVFRKLVESHESPNLVEKLARAERKVKEKEH